MKRILAALLVMGVVILLAVGWYLARQPALRVAVEDTRAVAGGQLVADEATLVELFMQEGWREPGVRALEDAFASEVMVVVPRQVVIELTDEVQAMRDFGPAGEVIGSYGVYPWGRGVRLKVQVPAEAGPEAYWRMVQVQLTKAAVMERAGQTPQGGAPVLNAYLDQYWQTGWLRYVAEEGR